MQKQQPLEFTGRYYMIQDMSSGKVLSVKSHRNRQSVIDEIMLEDINHNQLQQVWLVDHIKQNDYEIVHFQSTLVMENQNGDIILSRGSWKPAQFFYLQIKNRSTLQCSILQNQPSTLSFSSIRSIYYLQYAHRLICSNNYLFHNKPNWRLVAANNPIINKSLIIQSGHSLKVLDVPGASRSPGEYIIQYQRNNRCNQRWLIQQSSKSMQHYYIRSLLSSLVLDIRHGHISQGTYIIQWQNHQRQKYNQLWLLDYQGNGLYLIRSAEDQQYVLSVKGNTLDNAGYICISKDMNNSLWKLIYGQQLNKY